MNGNASNNRQLIAEPRSAAAAPKYGPRIIPKTVAIRAAKLISRVPPSVGAGILMGAMKERTQYKAAKIAMRATCFVVTLICMLFVTL